MGERLYKNHLGYYLCVLSVDGNTQPCVLGNVEEALTLGQSWRLHSLRFSEALLLCPTLIPLLSSPLLSHVRELPSVCAGNLWSRSVRMVYCQRLHRREATHYPWEDFLHLRLRSIYSTVFQRKVWNLRFTTYWYEQEGTTSYKTGNGTLVLSVVRESFYVKV